MIRGTFLLVPGAGGQAWYWHRVLPLLEAAGQRAVAVDLPAADEEAGLERYADVAVAAVPADAGPLVVVGQSMGALTAALVCTRRPVAELVLLNGMVPLPGETPGEWWAATGQEEAAAEAAERDGRPPAFDPVRDFFHDVPNEVTAEAMAAEEPRQSSRPFRDPWPLPSWPDVPTRVLAGSDDRLFPPGFQRRVAKERLGLEVQEIPGGHLAALSRPDAVASRLLETLVTGR